MPRPFRSVLATWHAFGFARRAVLGATLGVMALIAVGTALSLRQDQRHAIEEVYARDAQTALRLAASATEVLDQVEQSLRLLVYLAGRSEQTTLQSLASTDLIATRTTRSIFITDATGSVVDSTSADVPQSVADEDDFKRLKRSAAKGLLIGRPALNPLSQKWSVPMWRRLDRVDGGFGGVVVVDVDPAALVTPALRARATRSVVGILGDDGLYRARFAGDAALSVGDRLDVANFMQRIDQARAERRPVVSPLDGTARFASVADVPRYGLFALVASDAESALADFAETRSRTLRWAAVLVAATLVVAWLLGSTLTRLEASRLAAQRADRDFRAAIEGSLDGVAILAAERDAAGRIVDLTITDINTRAAEMVHEPRAGLLGRRVSSAMPALIDEGMLGAVAKALRDRHPVSGEVRCNDPRLAGRWIHRQVVPLENGAALIFRDVTEARDQARQLAALARFDSLTGLPNRRHFEESLAAARGRALRGAGRLALLYVDLDGFKAVNDTLGHEGGDLLLQGVALRLLESVRATDLVARLGGDEFAVLLEAAGGTEQIREICDRVLEALSLEHRIDDHPVTSTPSIGAVVLAGEESEESLRRRADEAMYEAKRAGKGRYHFVTEPVVRTETVAI
jgi:diguanylate cyclase (GGDEF)-like protein